MYAKYIKRLLDFFLSLCAIIILSPLLMALTVLGAITMQGNPFFTQPRPGKDEKIFKIIKFRTMTCKKDEHGNFLPDNLRLTKYGKFLRLTSLDELPELFNIIKGDMAVVGPRPLLVKYLPLYNEQQKRRHEVRPGLTGYAQAYGRNSLTWEEKFEKDIHYVEQISILLDLKIIIKTISAVFNRQGIYFEDVVTTNEFVGSKTEYAKHE